MFIPIGDDNIERGHFPVFSYGFILLNIAIFVFQSSMPEGANASFVQTFGSIPVEISQGVDLETLVTSIFLHGSWMHLIGNMLYLWIFADNIEATVGSPLFLVFYLLGGLAAGLAQVLINPYSQIPCIGASGAIAAVMGAYIVMFPRSRVKMLIIIFFTVVYFPAWAFLGFWFAQQLLSGMGALGMNGVDAGGVAWWAHIGGFAFGALVGFVFRKTFVSQSVLRQA
ncbi:MAG: rhomboid family intramembrane serine protease [Lewinellaceae bacterium]|nr:rhomboid family intramembrane serine protease [Lewinellaceae bacterium]